jgi:para-nitrobenzyl esterase
VAELFARYDRDPEEGLLDVPRLFADGSVLPSGGLLERLGRAGGWNSVPVMAGTNRDEQKLFMFASPIHVRRWLGVIPRVREPDLYLATAEAVSLLWKANGADAPAAAMRRVQPNVFVYRFDWDEEPRVLGFDVGRFVGAAHGFEIPFVFGHFVLGSATNRLFTGENRAGRETLSAWTTSYWAQFAYAGSPGRGRRGELPEWTAWDPASGAHKYAILDTPAGGGVRMGSDPVSEEEVFAAALSDARLRTPRERCFVLHELVPRAARFSFEDYAAACPDHPFDAFPWR